MKNEKNDELNKKKQNCNCEQDCKCGQDCDCGENCDCGEDCNCNDEKCNCGENNCNCADENTSTDKKCDCNTSKESEYKEKYLRILADFDNYRKRTDTIMCESRIDGIAEAVSSILPSMDSFAQAASMIKDKNILKGVQYIEKNIIAALTNLGVEEIPTDGQFDPNFHNALSTTDEGDAKNGQIVKVLSAGYKLGNRVIRYSQVIVKKEKQEKKENK